MHKAVKGLTALYVSHPACVNEFIKEGADVNTSDPDFSLDWRNKLYRKKFSPHTYDKDRGTALICAASSGCIENIQLLLEAGAEVNAVINGTTALNQAAYHGHHKCMEKLIKSGADVNSPSTLVELPLMSAARGYNPRKCLELLIESGANVNKVFDVGYEYLCTPLTTVCQSASPRCVSMLFKEGADMNFSRGRLLPLHEAVSYGKFGSAKLLLEAGADVNRRDSFGQTLLHAAIRKIEQKSSNQQSSPAVA